MHQDISDATFRIECGTSCGSAFSFRKENILVTNHHVIESHLTAGEPIFAVTESKARLATVLRGHSDKSQHDFALLEITKPLPNGRKALQPQPKINFDRGKRILFSGFPHGIPDLLVHEAIISGPAGNDAFYIDGSVNEGNSGGPIVDLEYGEVIGIVTQKRFLGGPELQALQVEVQAISQHCASIARGKVKMLGLDFGEFANLMAKGMDALSDIIKANANSGIGIGFNIEFVEQEFSRLKL